MRISICGGTGDIGAGLALRWAYDTDHEIIIGSRDPEKARMKADEYESELESRGLDRSIKGFVNEMAADRGDIVILAVPPYHVGDTVDSIADRLDSSAVLVSPAVGIKRDDDGAHYHRPPQGSVTELVAESAPNSVSVVGAFHNLPASRLANLDAQLNIDTAIVGDDNDAVDLVAQLAGSIEGIRPVHIGPLANATEVEAATALVVNAAIYNDDLHEVGIRFQ